VVVVVVLVPLEPPEQHQLLEMAELVSALQYPDQVCITVVEVEADRIGLLAAVLAALVEEEEVVLVILVVGFQAQLTQVAVVAAPVTEAAMVHSKGPMVARV
jgi:phosphoribosylcarboxyaminoimidazole (NCAIR) mutase